MAKWLKNILALVILAYLLWYLTGHWHQLKALLQLTLSRLATIYAICFLTSLVSARVVKCLLDALHAPTRFWEMVWLQNAAMLLNYAPMKFGTIFRANYLKRHYGLAYTHFATFFLYITFLMTLIAVAVGLLVLLTVYGLADRKSQVLAAVFVIALIASFAAIMLPLPLPKGPGRFSTIIRNFLLGRQKLSRQRRTILTASSLLTANFVLTALRLALIYTSIGQDIHPAGYLVLGSLAFVVLFVSLTPGALGIKEVVLSFGAVVLGVPFEVAVFAALIDRGVTLTYVFVVGGGCALRLWRKSPADFKNQSPAM